MRKQLRSEQSHHEKLKAQLAKGSDKENSRQGNGQDSNGERAKLEGEWEEKFRKMALMLKTKEEEIVVLRREQTNPGH